VTDAKYGLSCTFHQLQPLHIVAKRLRTNQKNYHERDKSMNTIVIHGNVGQEPEMRYTANQKAVITFSVGDTYGKDDKKKTTWHNVTAFGTLAENIANSIRKGDTVVVVGRLEQDEFTNKEGKKVKSTKLIADEVGYSLRWKSVVADQTAKVMSSVGQVFQGMDDDF
jgi:single-strand DNA-binding protein